MYFSATDAYRCLCPTAVFTPAPYLLVHAEAAVNTIFALAPLSLVLAETATDTVFAIAPLSLVLAGAVATTVFAPAPQLLVFAQDGALLGVLAAKGCGIGAVASPMHWLGSRHALRVCCACLVALWDAPPAFSSCPQQQPPGHPCDLTSYSALYLPCGGFLCSWYGASTVVWCPCPWWSFSLDLNVTLL